MSAEAGPVILSTGKKKKKKRYSSRLVKRAARSTEGHTKGLHRVVRAADGGIAEWRRQWDKSSRKRRDGGIRDVLRNRAKALSKFIKRASKAPSDVAKKQVRPPSIRGGLVPPFAFVPAFAGPSLPVALAVEAALRPGPRGPMGPLGPLGILSPFPGGPGPGPGAGPGGPRPPLDPAILGAIAAAVGLANGGPRRRAGDALGLAPAAAIAGAVARALAPPPPFGAPGPFPGPGPLALFGGPGPGPGPGGPLPFPLMAPLPGPLPAFMPLAGPPGPNPLRMALSPLPGPIPPGLLPGPGPGPGPGPLQLLAGPGPFPGPVPPLPGPVPPPFRPV